MTLTRLWHFTSTRHLPAILASGYLKLTDSNLHAVRPHHGPDCVWFLDVPTVDYDHGLAVPNFEDVDKTEVRIEALVPATWVRRWTEWADGQGIESDWCDALVRVGGGPDAARRWLVTFRTVKRDRWVRIDNRYTSEVYWSGDA